MIEPFTPPPSHHPQFPREQLSLTERVALKIMSTLNRAGWIQEVGLLWGRMIPQQLVRMIFVRRLKARQTELLERLPPNASIMIVANHRTFFDLFVIGTALRVETKNKRGIPSVFPVRAPFFYDNPLGVLMCLFFSGGCMYPPVFRDQRKELLNPVGVEAMKWLLTQPRVTLGIHPEGRRSKQPDPFKLEPARRGVGHLIQSATEQLYILPVFVEGIDRSMGRALKRALRPKRSPPINLWWGAPHPAQSYQGSAEEIAEAVNQRIQELADQARAELSSSRDLEGE